MEYFFLIYSIVKNIFEFKKVKHPPHSSNLGIETI